LSGGGFCLKGQKIFTSGAHQAEPTQASPPETADGLAPARGQACVSAAGIQVHGARCGASRGPFRQNLLIGGWYCPVCDDFITKPDPKLEAQYARAIAERNRKAGKA